MVKKYDGKIGFLEFLMIVIFCIGSRLTDTTPVLLTKSGLNASWMLPITSGLIILAPFLCVLSLLKLYSSKNLIDIIYHLTGKFIGFILTFMLLIITFEYIIITTRSYTDILSTMFYLKTPVYVLLLLLIASCTFIASKGINIVGSLCWFTYPVLQLIVFVLVPMIWKEMNFNYMFPLGGPGIIFLLKRGVIHTTIMGEIIVLAIFFPAVRTYKEYKNASLWGLIITIFQISLFMVIYTSTFGYPTLITLNYPFQQVTRLIHVGRFATNMESLFLGFWAISSTIRFAIYFYAAATVSSAITKIKNPKLLLPFIAVITFSIAILPENFTKYILRYREYGITTFWVYLLFLPILLWCIAKWKGDFNK